MERPNVQHTTTVVQRAVQRTGTGTGTGTGATTTTTTTTTTRTHERERKKVGMGKLALVALEFVGVIVWQVAKIIGSAIGEIVIGRQP